jgi:hypothetical protein
MKNYYIITDSNNKVVAEGIMTESQALEYMPVNGQVQCFGKRDSQTNSSFKLNGDMAEQFNEQEY